MIHAITLMLRIGGATVQELADALRCAPRTVWLCLCRNKRLRRLVKRSGDYRRSRMGGRLQPVWILA